MKIEKRTIQLQGKEYFVLIQRKKIKHTYLRVKEDHIAISTHPFTPLHAIMQLIRDNEGKILKHMKRLEERKQKPFRYLGNEINIHQYVGKRITYKWMADGELRVDIPPEKDLDSAMDHFIRKEAKHILPERFEICLSVFQQVYPIPRPTLKLRKMRSRYGSCYYKKNQVVLNTLNICYREEIIDYIIFHELCHFIHPNHSPAFYACLGQFVPNHQILRKELNTNES